jgi:hypothetical protein
VCESFSQRFFQCKKVSKKEGGIIKMHDFNAYNDKEFALQETK